MIEDDFQRLHFFEHGVGVQHVDFAELEQGGGEQVAVGDLFVDAFELDVFDAPDVAGQEEAGGEVGAAGVGDGVVDAAQEPEGPEEVGVGAGFEG